MKRLLVGLALALLIAGVIGIWMPEIRQWQQERAYRKERQRSAEGYAFVDRWLKRRTDYFSAQRTAEQTDKWYKQAKKEFCSDPDRQKLPGNVAQTAELTLLGNAPKTEDGSCGDAASYNPQ
jgi:hypothetical protein